MNVLIPFFTLSAGSLESHLMIILHDCAQHKQHISSPASMGFFSRLFLLLLFSSALSLSAFISLKSFSRLCVFLFCWTVYNELIYFFVLAKSVHLQPSIIYTVRLCVCLYSCLFSSSAACKWPVCVFMRMCCGVCWSVSHTVDSVCLC